MCLIMHYRELRCFCFTFIIQINSQAQSRIQLTDTSWFVRPVRVFFTVDTSLWSFLQCWIFVLNWMVGLCVFFSYSNVCVLFKLKVCFVFELCNKLTVMGGDCRSFFWLRVPSVVFFFCIYICFWTWVTPVLYLFQSDMLRYVDFRS